MTESEQTRDLCRLLHQCNAVVIALVAQMRQESGLPDRFIAHRTWSGWVEFKGLHTATTDKQRWFNRELNARGVNARIIRFCGTYLKDDISGDTHDIPKTPQDAARFLQWLSDTQQCAH